MKVINWHVKDIYYTVGERAKAMSYAQRFTKAGHWWLDTDDEGFEDFDKVVWEGVIQLKRDGRRIDYGVQ